MSAEEEGISAAVAPDPKASTRIEDNNEILFRQIHPTLYQDGVIASTAFRPTPTDKGQLSVDRSSLTTSAASFDLYVSNGRESVAVYGVSVGQYGAEGVFCHPDPLPATDKLKANPAHAYADFSGIVSLKDQRRKAQRLRDRALERGRLHPPV